MSSPFVRALKRTWSKLSSPFVRALKGSWSKLSSPFVRALKGTWSKMSCPSNKRNVMGPINRNGLTLSLLRFPRRHSQASNSVFYAQSSRSLSKRPIKVPNLKSLRPLFPFARGSERISIKTRSTESRFLTGPSNILFASVYVCTFQPENFYRLGQ